MVVCVPGKEMDEELGEEEGDEVEEGEEGGGMVEKHHTDAGLSMATGNVNWFDFSFDMREDEAAVMHAFNKRRWHLRWRVDLWWWWCM